MSLINQADFARLHNVSRKTVTTWKKRGYIELFGGLVDVERSNAKLAGVGRAWPPSVTKPIAPVTQTLRKWPAVVTEPDGCDWTQMTGLGVGVDETVLRMSTLADSAVEQLARLIVRYLPANVALKVVEEFHRRHRDEVVWFADEEIAPPTGCSSWAYHPLFQGPVVSYLEWREALAEAAEWREGQNGTHA